MPPVARTRMIMSPSNDAVMPPIPVVNHPGAKAPADSKGAIDSRLIVNQIRLVDGHVDFIRLGRLDFNSTVVVDDCFLRGVGKVAEHLGLAPQALDGVHDVLLLVEEGLAYFSCP